jgi:hypothetical protein
MDSPEGAIPSGWLEQTCLATGHHAEVSALSSRGDRCIPYPDHYSPAFAFSAILYPQPMHPILQPGLSRPAARRGYGLTLFRAVSTDREDPTFLPVIVLSACPHQAGRHPITYRFGRSLSVDLARSGLTAFTSGSRMLVLRPSLAPHPDFDFQNHTVTLTGTMYPLRVATLSVRSARGRYRPRTAPRLLAAERQVAYTLPRGQQLIARFAPRKTTHLRLVGGGCGRNGRFLLCLSA